MYYCANCGNIFDPMSYATLRINNIRDDKRVICPVKNCGCEILDVDESIIPLISSLNKYGVIVSSSFVGNVQELSDNPLIMYITYEYHNKDGNALFIKNFTTKIIKMREDEQAYPFLKVEVNKSVVVPDIGTNKTIIKVGATNPNTRWNASILEKQSDLLKRQADFISAMNTAIEDTKIALNM